MLERIEKTLKLVASALKVRTAKQTLIASNIANIDTPGYRRKDISFKKVMEAYLSQQTPLLPLKTTHLKHIQIVKNNNIEELIKLNVEESNTLGTPNNVSLDEELVNLTQNQILYETTLQALNKELQRLKEAITEGGR